MRETMPTEKPARSYSPLWQAHQMRCRSGRYCTVQSRCVQVAENARNSPAAVRMTMAGLDPKGTTRPEFGARAAALPPLTESVAASATSGGARYLAIG